MDMIYYNMLFCNLTVTIGNKIENYKFYRIHGGYYMYILCDPSFISTLKFNLYPFL